MITLEEGRGKRKTRGDRIIYDDSQIMKSCPVFSFRTKCEVFLQYSDSVVS